MNPGKIKIGLVDNHNLVRRGFKLIIEGLENCEVILEAANGKDLIEKLEKVVEKPSIILLEISMPVMDGHQTVAYLSKHHKEINCIALSINSDFTSVFKIIDCGAKAYLMKDCDTEHLFETIKQVHDKGIYMSSFVLTSIHNYNQAKGEIENRLNKNLFKHLGDREIEFVKLCCSDLAYKEIAEKMHIQPRTVDSYRESVFNKLKIKSRSALVIYAIKKKIFKP